jgi:hypothetical protein
VEYPSWRLPDRGGDDRDFVMTSCRSHDEILTVRKEICTKKKMLETKPSGRWSFAGAG